MDAKILTATFIQEESSLWGSLSSEISSKLHNIILLDQRGSDGAVFKRFVEVKTDLHKKTARQVFNSSTCGLFVSDAFASLDSTVM